MIAKPYRCRGLGTNVVRFVEERIYRNPNIAYIRSGVQVNNPSAIRFWQRMGYEISSRPVLMPDTTTVYPLIKNIKTV